MRLLSELPGDGFARGPVELDVRRQHARAVNRQGRFQHDRIMDRELRLQLPAVVAEPIALDAVRLITAEQRELIVHETWYHADGLDDEGAVLRILSTIVTVLGYVLFMGSLIAIMTQWLAQTISRFERGMAPIAMRGHVVILGWTNRTPEIVRELLIARGRLRRFLEAHDQRALRIVIVADEVNADRRHELRSFLGEHWRNRQIFMRAGSELSLGDLARFDLPHAAAIIVPGDEFTLQDEDEAIIEIEGIGILRNVVRQMQRAQAYAG